MNALEVLLSISRENNLRVWSNKEIEKLGNQIVITNCNKILETFTYTGIDKIDDSTTGKHDLIIGNQIIYHVQFLNRGQEIEQYNTESDIYKFLSGRLIDHEELFIYKGPGASDWIDCWKSLHKIVENSLIHQSANTILKVSLLDRCLNDRSSSGLFINGVTGIYLKIQNPETGETFTIEFKYESISSNDQSELDIYIKANYEHRDRNYGIKFFHSKKVREKYDYPCTPNDFGKMIDNFKLNNFTRIVEIVSL